jgi:hypothetical protein
MAWKVSTAYANVTKEMADLKRKCHHSRAAAADLMEKHLWWWRRQGELLEKTPLNTGAKGLGKCEPSVGPHFPTLEELGIERHDCQRSQQIASIPKEDFAQHIKTLKENDAVDLTRSYFLQLAKSFRTLRRGRDLPR